MKQYPIKVGSVVQSLAGRDQGRLFVVMEELDADFVAVANGALRGIERQKKKRRKHLKPTGAIVPEPDIKTSFGLFDNALKICY